MLEENQVTLFKKVKSRYTKYYNKKSKDYSYLYYLSPNSNLGNLILKSILGNKQSFFNNLVTIFKETLYSLNYINYKIISNKTEFNYKKIIITWAFKNDFKKDGSFFDRYFKINSKKLKDTLWVIVYRDKEMPKNIQKNIFFIKPENKFSLNIFPILKLIIINLHFLFKDKKLFISSISNHNFFSNLFLNEVKRLLNKDVKTILFTYEGQIFQNRFIQYISKKFRNITSIGYVHTPPMAAPFNLVYNSCSPDKIILSGKDQIHCFTKFLGWQKSKIIFLPSFRFNKFNLEMKNKIFLPLSVINEEKIFKGLETLYKNNIINLKNFKIKSHPASINSKKNIKTVINLKKFIKLVTKKDKKNFRNNDLIFVGISGAIIEALESGYKVIQISDDPKLDTYSEKLWPSLRKKRIYSDIFEYKLMKKQKLIKLGNITKNLENLKYLGKY